MASDTSSGQTVNPHAYWARNDVINPIHDNIFLHVSPEVGHTLIISLVYFSFWLGALGWDIFSTVAFDFRLFRETKWRSPFSVVNSLAYLLSRYFTFAWILKCVLDGFTASRDCRERLVQSASLYGVAVCSTYLVFLLRTINLWRAKVWVASPLVICFLAMIALCAVLPQNMSVQSLPGDPFCNYQLGGWLSYAVLTACAIFDLLNFILLGVKLSRTGIKGILRCLLPQTEANYDHEDVTQMLLQKTGIFTIVQFLLLISIGVIYGTLPQLNYQLMQVACFHAISASMAGRIFRRAWRLSREQSATNINQPPGYQSAWAERSGLGGNGTQGKGGIDGVPVSKKKEQDLLRDDESYVEGEFRLTTKDRDKVSAILPRSRPGTAGSTVGGAPHTGSSLRSTETSPSSNRDQPVESIALQHQAIDMDPTGPVQYPPPPPSILTDSRSLGANDYTADVITFADATPSCQGSRDASPQRASHHVKSGMRTAGRGRRASTSVGPVRAQQIERSQRPQTTDSSVNTVVHIIRPGAHFEQSPDIVDRSRRSPTWSNVGLESSIDSVQSRRLGLYGSERSSRSKLLGERPKSSGSAGSKSVHSKDLRPIFMASPAMTTGTSAGLGSAGHGVVDFNAAKAAASSLQTVAGPSKAQTDGEQNFTSRPKTANTDTTEREPGSLFNGRPRTAPQEEQTLSNAILSSPRTTAEDPLRSFWSTVQADEERHQQSDATLDDGRPRTSRGGPGTPAPFGHRESRRSSFATVQQDAQGDGRPSAAHGAIFGRSVGTFGRFRSHKSAGESMNDVRPGTSSGADRLASDGQFASHWNERARQTFHQSHLSQDGKENTISSSVADASAVRCTDDRSSDTPESSAIGDTYRELERMAYSPSISSLRQDADVLGRSSLSSASVDN
ncbi:unnamed protein product [Sympodiomycopsis kandeliae]